MAGDWIKMRCELGHDPDVIQIAALLNIDEFAVVGRLHAVWSWLDQHSESGTNVRIVSAYLDRLTACPGFADAMRTVGWLDGRDGNLTFPGYETHNGDTAKRRAVETKRKRTQRDKCPKANGTNVPTDTGLEKRREETTSILTNRSKCTLAEAQEFAVELGLPATDGEACFQRWEGNGWKNGTNRIKDWKATMRSWKASGYMPSQKVNGAAKPGGRPLDLGGRKPAAILELPRTDELEF